MASQSKMARLPLLNHRGRWTMRFRGKRAEFVDLRSAAQAAICEAYHASKNGTPTQVVSIDGDTGLEVLWTYGVDPDPAIAPPASGRQDVLRMTARRRARGGRSFGNR